MRFDFATSGLGARDVASTVTCMVLAGSERGFFRA
jgi:hypothetical protein